MSEMSEADADDLVRLNGIMRLGRDEGLTRLVSTDQKGKKSEGQEGSPTSEARETPPLLYCTRFLLFFLLSHLHSALDSGMARRLWRRGHLEASKPQGGEKRDWV